MIELDLMTEEQHSALPEDEEVTAADRLIIDSPTATGLIVLKALAPEPGVDAAGAGLARGIALHRADRVSTGQAARTGAACAGPCARAEGQALKTVCHADAEIARSEKR